MNLKDLLKTMFHAYFVIATGATMSMYVCCLLFSPNASFSPVDIGGVLLVALASDLSLLVFCSKKDLNRRQMLIRFFIYIPATVIMLLVFAYGFNWINMNSPAQIAVFILLVLGVYAGVIAVVFYHDKKIADQLNNGLKNRYHSQVHILRRTAGLYTAYCLFRTLHTSISNIQPPLL